MTLSNIENEKNLFLPKHTSVKKFSSKQILKIPCPIMRSRTKLLVWLNDWCKLRWGGLDRLGQAQQIFTKLDLISGYPSSEFCNWLRKGNLKILWNCSTITKKCCFMTVLQANLIISSASKMNSVQKKNMILSSLIVCNLKNILQKFRWTST